MTFRFLFVAIVVAALILALRRIWVIRGTGFLAVSLVLAAGDAASSLLHRTSDWINWVLFWFLPIASGVLARNSWLVSSDAAEVTRIVEQGARALWMPFTKSGLIYEFQPPGARLRLRRIPLGRRHATLTFSSGRGHKKMELLRRLLFKKFPPLFPRLRIRL